MHQQKCLSGFPAGSAAKESSCTAGDLGLIPGLGRSLGEGKGYPLQYSGQENSMDCIVHKVAKSQTWLSDWLTQSSTPIASKACVHWEGIYKQVWEKSPVKNESGLFPVIIHLDPCS